MSNLLQETINAIKNSGHTSEDIIFIGSEDSGHRCNWEEYKKLADINYNSGFGHSKIATDLIIVFNDGSKMWRGEYDGSEWWEYITPFKIPAKKRKIKTLCNGDMWATLEDMQKPNGKYGKKEV